MAHSYNALLFLCITTIRLTSDVIGRARALVNYHPPRGPGSAACLSAGNGRAVETSRPSVLFPSRLFTGLVWLVYAERWTSGQWLTSNGAVIPGGVSFSFFFLSLVPPSLRRLTFSFSLRVVRSERNRRRLLAKRRREYTRTSEEFDLRLRTRTPRPVRPQTPLGIGIRGGSWPLLQPRDLRREYGLPSCPLAR